MKGKKLKAERFQQQIEGKLTKTIFLKLAKIKTLNTMQNTDQNEESIQ